VQSSAETKLSSPIGGTIAAVGPALSALPFVIVSAGHLVHLTASTLPVVNIPQTSIIEQSCDALTVQPQKDSSASVLQSSVLSPCSAEVAKSLGLIQRTVFTTLGGVMPGTKSVPRLSRLNAVDLSLTSVTDSDITLLPVTAAPAPQTTSVTDSEVSESADADRILQRREIAPIPGAVCSAEEAARVGSSYLCSFCGKTFSSAPQLAVHRNIHYFERLKCSICRLSFASRAALEQHRSKEHDGEDETVASADPRPFKCDECGVAFRIQGHLAKHKRSKVHAARLENSQDVPGAGDAEECRSALPLSADERDAEEGECDECQHEAVSQEMDSAVACEHQKPDSGEICHLSNCCSSCTYVVNSICIVYVCL